MAVASSVSGRLPGRLAACTSRSCRRCSTSRCLLLLVACIRPCLRIIVRLDRSAIAYRILKPCLPTCWWWRATPSCSGGSGTRCARRTTSWRPRPRAPGPSAACSSAPPTASSWTPAWPTAAASRWPMPCGPIADTEKVPIVFVASRFRGAKHRTEARRRYAPAEYLTTPLDLDTLLARVLEAVPPRPAPRRRHPRLPGRRQAGRHRPAPRAQGGRGRGARAGRPVHRAARLAGARAVRPAAPAHLHRAAHRGAAARPGRDQEDRLLRRAATRCRSGRTCWASAWGRSWWPAG